MDKETKLLRMANVTVNVPAKGALLSSSSAD